VGVVAAGYLAAFAIAFVVVAMHVAATSTPDRQTYGAMFAFGDSLLFLAVLGVAAVPATGVGLYFLRPHRVFWRILSVAALAVSAISLAALLDHLAPADPRSGLHAWLAVASLGILVAPLFAMLFVLALLLAPNRSSRMSLALATAIEAGVFVTWFFAVTQR
jgi:hypothetical protein